jgi:uncharacterized repeat protein (TIGR01451 family)
MSHPLRSWRRRAIGLISSGLLGGLLASEAHAQMPPGLPGAAVAPPPAAAPLATLPPPLFVRIAGPKGMKATFFRGGAQGQTIETPCVVGLRPGYTYRVALSDVPGFPAQVFFPSLQVRASLWLGNRLRNADFPATLIFSEEDLARAQAGALVRKVIVLERPDEAIPVASKADEPLEVRVLPPRDPVAEAQDRGQPLALVHLGQRSLTADELAYSGVPGTVLLPGEKVLGAPAQPPHGPWVCFPVVDPIGGPIHPGDFVCLPDGGDIGLPVGYGPDGKLRGLDPSDTVAEYVDARGRKRLAVSNRVCLCVPRFIITRGEIGLGEEVGLVAVARTQVANGFDIVSARQALVAEGRKLSLEWVGHRLRLGETENLYGTAIVGKVQGLEIRAALRSVEVVEGLCLQPQAPVELPLLIIKWPDKCGAMVGDVVTFYLRYTNRGGLPISDVVVTDSLIPRFEYVAGSAKTDREAIFTIQPNEVGSTVLRWQFNGVLQPRETGLVSFQVRIR